MTEQRRAEGLRAVQRGAQWCVDGDGPADLGLVNEFLGYVADRRYSPRTERAYAFDLLAFTRWLVDEHLTVGLVTTDALLRFLTFCRSAVLPGQTGGNVVPLRTGRAAGMPRRRSTGGWRRSRVCSTSGRCGIRPWSTRCRGRRRHAGRVRRSRAGGLLAHLDRPKSRSRLRVREPRRLPRWLDPNGNRCAARQFPHRPGPGDRRVDAVLRVAVGRGAWPCGQGRRHRRPLDPCHRQGRQGTAGTTGSRRRRVGADLPVR